METAQENNNDFRINFCQNAHQLEKYGFKCNCTDCGGSRYNGKCYEELKYENKIYKMDLTSSVEKKFSKFEDCFLSIFSMLTIIGENKSKIE